METKSSFILFFLLAAASAATINADSYIDLDQQGYVFSFSNTQGPVQLSITGLPQGLAIQDYTVTPVGPVRPGQYILSVKAMDNVGKDEKILIMNVDSSLATYIPRSASTSNVTTQSSSSSIKAQTISTNSVTSSNSISSISSLFDSGTNAFLESPTTASVDSLQNFFNNIDTTSTSRQNTQNIGSNLSQILSDFSSTNTNTYAEASMPSVSAQTIVSQNSIILNFNASQRATVSTQEANKLFQQQKQATEWVAGNYSIVLQLTADKNTLNIVIANLTEKYQIDQQAQKDAAAALNAAANNRSKIQSAIGNLNSLLGTLKTQTSASSSKLSQLEGQRQELSSQAGQTQSKFQQISQNIQAVTTQIQTTTESLASNAKNCDSHNSNLLQANKTLNIYSSQLGLVNQQLNNAASQISNRRAVVDDLMKQLAIAQQQLQMANDNANNLTAQRNLLQLNITSTGNNILSITQNLNSCTAQSATIRQTLASYQANLTSLQAALSQYSNQNSTQSSQILTIQSQIAQQTVHYNNLQNQTSSASAALDLLKAALPNVTATLTSLTTLKTQADLTLQDSLASLQAAISSFKNYSANLEMATMHLQNARALSQQADLAVNNMLAQKGNILPFAVAVNSSRNALIGQTIVSPSVNISNWFNYLSANFGSAAFAYQSSPIHCLYPFSLESLNLRNSIPCPSESDSLKTITGKVARIVSFNEIVVAVDASSSQQTVEIPSCATLNSNIEGYRVSAGDSAIVKGVQGIRSIVAKEIVFLRQ